MTISVSTFGQKVETFATPIQTVDRIFNIYIQASESPDSEANKNAMAKAFEPLQLSLDKKDLPLLINVWMYYNPTDFPTRELIYPIFQKHKSAALNAIDKRLKKKEKWETKENAPYSDLVALKKQSSRVMRGFTNHVRLVNYLFPDILTTPSATLGNLVKICPS